MDTKQASHSADDERFRLAFEHAGVGIALQDTDAEDSCWLRVNHKLCDILGYTREELLKISVLDLLPRNDRDRNGLLDYYKQLLEKGQPLAARECRFVHKNGQIIWGRLTLSLASRRDHGSASIISIVEDITEQKKLEFQVMYLAHYDNLTGLPNRAMFSDRLNQTLALSKRNDWTTAVFLLGLDNFKLIADTRGLGVGDALLREVTSRISANLRTEDTPARFGNDEFAIILGNVGTAQDAAGVAQKLLDAIARPVVINKEEMFLSASIGITLHPADGADTDTLLSNADVAMLRAKEQDKNSYQFYTAKMNERAREKLQLANQLHRALENNEFILHYQPKIAIATGMVAGVEALLRWQRPGIGLTPPSEFIPLLEDTGLIGPVTDWIIHTACRQAVAWRDAGLRNIRIAVNLSPRQFQKSDAARHMLSIVESSEVDSDLLEMEITESLLMRDPMDAARIVTSLRAAGIHISLDDFGTGYSSLSYLSHFPMNSIKIDRSFIVDVIDNAQNAAITRTIIGLAHNLGMIAVAEGVETAEQVEFLTTHQCDHIQGYFFSKPLPAEDCGKFISSKNRR